MTGTLPVSRTACNSTPPPGSDPAVELLSLPDALPVCDAILTRHATAIGADLVGYRHHVYRVVHLCAAQASLDAVAFERLQVAAAFHDLGIWTHGTFDYLGPSIDLAHAYLQERGHVDALAEVGAMILEHHKLRSYRGGAGGLVEPFRRADWIDVTRGLRRFGVDRAVIRSLYARWPSAGFHRRLVALSLARLRSHPRAPLPMFRL